MIDSGKADAQDGQNAAQPDADFTQEKAADTTVVLIKPSEPSGPSASAETDNGNDKNQRTNADVSKSTIFRLGHSDIFGCNDCKQSRRHRD